jgi:hypothetical protein
VRYDVGGGYGGVCRYCVVDAMTVYLVWFSGEQADDLVRIFSTEDGAKAFIKEHSTFGNESLWYGGWEVE